MATEFSPATFRIVFSKMLFSGSVRPSNQGQNRESLGRQRRRSGPEVAGNTIADASDDLMIYLMWVYCFASPQAQGSLYHTGTGISRDDGVRGRLRAWDGLRVSAHAGSLQLSRRLRSCEYGFIRGRCVFYIGQLAGRSIP